MQSPKSIQRFIISGGGTGGHIFPAISIARALEQAAPGCELLFVGAQGRMEMERVPAAGYRIEGLPISGIQRSLSLQNLKFPFRLLASLWQARGIVRRFKPHAVVGVGGYASGPLLYAAQWQGIPTFIQEQNAYAGLTNKWLAGRVKRAYVAYEGMERYFPAGCIQITGNPIRQDLFSLKHQSAESLSHFKLTAGNPVVLVLGGSLGARMLNHSTRSALPLLAKAGVQLIWQTGKSFAPEAAAALQAEAELSGWTGAFIDRMDLAYSAADLIISRAGAGTISELAVVGKPVVLVPSPHVAEDHQTKNALALTSKQAALLVRDAEAGDKLYKQVIELLNNADLQQSLRSNLVAFDRRNAASEIAADILKTIETGGKS
jgi:UDP-N-acetylglucosamine--N-acetylmuramyl-(pentapeptide) pyrophosphoryl-undecaprenol N-acetylglucosamine transferase